MKRLVAVLACLAAAVAAGHARAEALPCGLPESRPLWVDFADRSVDFRFQVFGRPGLVLAANGIDGPAQLRALGARTVYWHMHLHHLVGRSKAPADPASVVPAAEALVEKAVASTGCATPVIALNELWGARLRTPWPPEHAQYRANVLTLLRTIAARGGLPFLLVAGRATGPRAPAVDGDARVWWHEVARYAHILREMHFNAPDIAEKRPLVGSRLRREAMRRKIATFTDVGIPLERLDMVLGFQSGPGKGGREGLKPREAWFEIVKLEALAARQVAGELGITSIWSWGWGTSNPAGADPDKPAAACVYLWTRDPTLCDGPGAAGPGFDPSPTPGQIDLPPGFHCRTGLGWIESASVDELAALTESRRAALTALLSRLVYRDRGGLVTPGDLDAAERMLIARNFGGSLDAYLAELERRGVGRRVAREVMADQFRRQRAEARFTLDGRGLSPQRWARQRKKVALRSAVCLRDERPMLAAIDWRTLTPSLGLPEPSVSIRVRAPALGPRIGSFLTGRVVSARAFEVVTVYGRRHGATGFAKVGRARVAADGSWSLKVSPLAPTMYRALTRSAVSRPVVVGARAA